MTENLEITLESSFVHVLCSGAVDTPTIQEFFTRMPEAARDAGVSKILFDGRNAIVQLSLIERFNNGCRIKEVFKGLQLACVLRPSPLGPDLFGETVAVNRGAFMRVFTTLAAACEWLRVKRANKEE